MQPNPLTPPGVPSNSPKANQSRSESGADQPAEPFGAVIARVATQQGKDDNPGSAPGRAKDSSTPAAAESGADAVAAGAKSEQEVASGDAGPIGSVDALLASVLPAPVAKEATPAPAVTASLPMQGAANGFGDEIEAPAAELIPANDASARPERRGPNARAFTQANAHAQPALAAAAARHGETGSPAAAEGDATGLLVEAASNERAAASMSLSRSEAPLAHPVAQPALPQQASAAALTPARVNIPFSHPRFADEFGDKVVWLARGQISSAEIALTPSELGPVRVAIEIRGTDATIHFGAAAAATRAALEEALPRLKEMLSQQGLNLTDANVGSETTRDERQQSNGSTARRERALFDAEASAAPAARGGNTRGVRLIDVVA